MCSDFKVAQVNRPRNHCYYDNRLLRANRNKNRAWSTLNYAHPPCVRLCLRTSVPTWYLRLRRLFLTTYAGGGGVGGGGPSANFHGGYLFSYFSPIAHRVPRLTRIFNYSDTYLETMFGVLNHAGRYGPNATAVIMNIVTTSLKSWNCFAKPRVAKVQGAFSC